MRLHVLRVEFEITADLVRIADHLRFLKQSAEQPVSPRRLVRYHVAERDGAHVIKRDGEEVDVQFDANAVLAEVDRRIYRDAVAAWPEAASLAGITGSFGAERFLLAGGTPWDRMRLVWALIASGAQIEGAGMALIDGANVTAVPRALPLAGSRIPVPASLPPVDDLPSLVVWGERSWAVDLADAAIPWRIRSGPVDRVILLETNYGGQSRHRRLPAYEAARRLAPFCRHPDPLLAVRAAAELAGSAAANLLWLGSFDDLHVIWRALRAW